MSVPDYDLIGPAAQEALDGGVYFAGQQLPHLAVFGLGLVLAANTSDALGIGDHEYGFFRLRPDEATGQQDQNRGSHCDVWYQRRARRAYQLPARLCATVKHNERGGATE